MFINDSKLFHDPDIQYPIENFDLSFSDYILKSKQIIQENRLDLNKETGLIIEANAPFELKPQSSTGRYGALLIHGLLTSPFQMLDLGHALQANGILTRSIVLPGHSTVPGSLLNVKYEDWVHAVRYGVSSLAKEVDEIFLVGFSTGATLSIHHFLHEPAKIAGIIMLCPALKINSVFAGLSHLPHRARHIFPNANWLYKGNEIDYAKYESLPFNAVHQVYRLTQAIKKMDYRKLLTQPIFMALTYEDLIVCSKTTINLFHTLTHPKDRMILYARKKHLFDDARITVRPASYPEWNIESFSHISIPIAPSNPHYGKQGDFPLASHISSKNHIYCALDKPRSFFYETLYKLKLTPFLRQRLTFNPDFDYLASQINSFIFSK